MALALMVLLATCAAAQAQDEAGGPYPAQAYQGWRVHGGWGWPADENQQTVWGADYIWQHALVTVNYFKGDRQRLSFNPPITGATHAAQDEFWSLEGSYLWRPTGEPTVYAGAGWGVVRMSRDDEITIVAPPFPKHHETRHGTAGIGNLVLGKEFPRHNEFGRSAFFMEARWNFLAKLRDSDAGQDVDIQGLRFVLGWRF
jgi:hypothetical protein